MYWTWEVVVWKRPGLRFGTCSLCRFQHPAIASQPLKHSASSLRCGTPAPISSCTYSFPVAQKWALALASKPVRHESARKLEWAQLAMLTKMFSQKRTDNKKRDENKDETPLAEEWPESWVMRLLPERTFSSPSAWRCQESRVKPILMTLCAGTQHLPLDSQK